MSKTLLFVWISCEEPEIRPRLQSSDPCMKSDVRVHLEAGRAEVRGIKSF